MAKTILRFARPARTRDRRYPLAIALALVSGWSIGMILPDGRSTVAAAAMTTPLSRTFGSCHRGGGIDCVVDGDTFWMAGEKIRIADIDAPETHPSRCDEEARLGAAATVRLQALLNAGPVELAVGARDIDRYGRKLRVVMRDGQSLGDMLVRDGLARRWEGRRRPWCAETA